MLINSVDLLGVYFSGMLAALLRLLYLVEKELDCVFQQTDT